MSEDRAPREGMRTVFDAGYAAGLVGAASSPNPYAPEPVPPWHRPRTRAGLAEWERRREPARLRARVWREAWRVGIRKRFTELGLNTPR